MTKRNKRGTSQIDILVGQNIKILRSQRGMSQSALGEHLELTFQQIQKYEKGTNRVAASTLYEMARVFGVTFEAFFQGAEHIKADSTDMPPKLSSQAYRLAIAYDANDNQAFKKAVSSLVQTMDKSVDAEAA